MTTAIHIVYANNQPTGIESFTDFLMQSGHVERLKCKQLNRRKSKNNFFLNSDMAFNKANPTRLSKYSNSDFLSNYFQD